MLYIAQVFTLLMVLVTTGSCARVGFQAKPDDGSPAQSAGATPPDGSGCTDGTCATPTYGWNQSGFGLCSKPCGTGDQAQIVDCRRSTDQVVVSDSYCTGTKPIATRTCNANQCVATYQWGFADFGACPVTCGGGTQTRAVVCQNQAGLTIPDSNCSGTKPATSAACGADPCGATTFAWKVNPAVCPLTCANTVASVTDGAVCLKSDGTTAAGSQCPGQAPVITHQCNQEACPEAYTYAWTSGAYSDCDRTCGGGVQTRSTQCQRNDGLYVNASFCPAGSKPVAQATCNPQACPTGGRAVTQQATVPPTATSVDVVLVIDDSSSMKDDQTKLATRMSTLLADLDAQNVDYQVCLTTTDTGYWAGSPLQWKGLNSVVMTKSSPNKNQVFIDTINALGAEWSSDERAIYAQYMMIKNFRNSGCLRDKAALSTIVISDEDERSVGGDQSLSKAQYQPLESGDMVANLISLVHSTFDGNGFTKPFLWNSIIDIPGDAACMAQQDKDVSPSFYGKMYAQLSGATGGAIGSICDNDYTQNLKFIKDRIVNSMPGLTMECTPVGTPVVTLVPAFATSVSTSGNQMTFSPALPENTQITAKYSCPN